MTLLVILLKATSDVTRRSGFYTPSVVLQTSFSPSPSLKPLAEELKCVCLSTVTERSLEQMMRAGETVGKEQESISRKYMEQNITKAAHILEYMSQQVLDALIDWENKAQGTILDKEQRVAHLKEIIEEERNTYTNIETRLKNALSYRFYQLERIYNLSKTLLSSDTAENLKRCIEECMGLEKRLTQRLSHEMITKKLRAFEDVLGRNAILETAKRRLANHDCNAREVEAILLKLPPAPPGVNYLEQYQVLQDIQKCMKERTKEIEKMKALNQELRRDCVQVSDLKSSLEDALRITLNDQRNIEVLWLERQRIGRSLVQWEAAEFLMSQILKEKEEIRKLEEEKREKFGDNYELTIDNIDTFIDINRRIRSLMRSFSRLRGFLRVLEEVAHLDDNNASESSTQLMIRIRLRVDQLRLEMQNNSDHVNRVVRRFYHSFSAPEEVQLLERFSERQELNFFAKNTERINETVAESSVSGGLDLERIRNLIMQINEATEPCKGRDLVFIAGETRVGKGTIINYLRGVPHIRVKAGNVDAIGLVRDDQNCAVITSIQDQPWFELINRRLAPTSHGMRSHTILPALYDDRSQIHTFCDLAGFGDTRGEEERVCSSIGWELAVKKSRSVKIVMVIDGTTLQGACEGFTKIIDIINRLSPHSAKEKPDILFLFNKCDHWTKDIIIEKIEMAIEELGRDSKDTQVSPEQLVQIKKRLEALIFIKERPHRIKIVNVLDQFESRREIEFAIQELSPISSKLDFRYESARLKFNEALVDIVGDLTKLLQAEGRFKTRMKYVKAQEDFAQRTVEQYREKLDNPQELEALAQRDPSLERQEKEARLANLVHQIDVAERQLAEERRKKATYDKDTPVKYWEDSVYEERTRFLGLISFRKTEATFRYEGIRFTRADAHPRCDFSISVYEPDNGRWVGHYDSGRNSDGDAKVEVFVRYKDQPDIQRMIRDLDQTIGVSESNITALKEMQRVSTDEAQQERNRQIEGVQEHFLNRIRFLEGRLDSAQSLKRNYEYDHQKYERSQSEFPIIRNLIDCLYPSDLPDVSPLFEAFRTQLRVFVEQSQAPEQELDPNMIDPIYGEPLLDAVQTPCGHVFNRFTIMRWLSHNSTCPTCRAPANQTSLISIPWIDLRTAEELNSY